MDLTEHFMVSKNIMSGMPIRYSFREKSSVSQLNGWNILSEIDDEEYVNNAENFSIISAYSIYLLAPQMLEIFEAPYGTDLFLVYEEKVHIGFYDLVGDAMITIDQILGEEQS